MSAARYLIHSFPRPSTKSASKDLERGLSILSSILDLGLLLTPETLYFPFIGGKDPEDTGTGIFQIRACFTFLPTSDIYRHASAFGPFCLCFDPLVLRKLGAMPVMYVPRPSDEFGDDNFSLLANAIVQQVRDVDILLKELTNTLQALEASPDKGFVDVSFGSNTVERLHAPSVLRFLTMLQRQEGGFEKIRGFVIALSNLFYHLDSARAREIFREADFLYYLQAEWRIISGLTLGARHLDRPLSQRESRHLASQSEFLNKPVETPNKQFRPRIEFSKVIETVDEAPFWKCIEHLIIPDVCESAVHDMLKRRSISIPVEVIRYSEVLEERQRQDSRKKHCRPISVVPE